MRPTISVALITLNEEANLPRTLASVQFADHFTQTQDRKSVVFV